MTGPRVGRAVPPSEEVLAWLSHHVSVGIDGAVTLRIPGADFENPGVTVRTVHQVMAVGDAGLEGRAVAGRERLFALVGHQDNLAVDHEDEFVLVAVPVPLTGPRPRG